MQVKEPTFSVSNMFTFNSQQYFKYFDFDVPWIMRYCMCVFFLLDKPHLIIVS